MSRSNNSSGDGSKGNNMVSATVSIRGYRKLLWHHLGVNALPLEKEEKSGVAGNDPDEWRRTVLATRSRQLYLEPEAIFSCLRQAAKYTKKGRFSIQPAVAATLQVDDSRILVDRYLPKNEPTTNPDKPVFVHVKSVRNPSTSGRNIRYRICCSQGWKAAFHLVWDKTVVSRNEMNAIVNDAGRLVGIGDGRTIGYGKFTVTSFKIRGESHERIWSSRRTHRKRRSAA